MSYSEKPSGSHHFRFYLVLATLLIVGVFALLLLNNNGSLGLSSAIVGENSNLEDSEFANNQVDSEDQESTSGSFVDKVKGTSKGTRDLALSLSFDQVPKVNTKTKIDEIDLKFRDTKSKIKVNNDYLELNNLQDIHLELAGFDGTASFDGSILSLDGKATRIAVNDVALSARSDIRITIENLNYDELSVGRIALGELKIARRNGIIDIASRLHYELSADALQLYSYIGSFQVNSDQNSGLTLLGSARRVDLQGDSVSLSVQ